jgi:hypothetical protein
VGGVGCEIAAFIDPGGKSYGTSHPPGQEANMERNITLIGGDNAYDQTVPYEKLADSGECTPVLWDRTAGDRLVAMYANNPPLDWVYLEIQFLANSTASVPSIGTGY